MVMDVVKKIALKTTMDSAKKLYKKGNTVEEIAGKFWKHEQISAGLNVLGITEEELIKMIKDKVELKSIRYYSQLKWLKLSLMGERHKLEGCYPIQLRRGKGNSH